jgi:magnesium-transporting ATPase (P-type)
MGLGVLEAGVVMAVLTLLTLDLFLPGGLIEPVDAWLGAGPHSLELARTAAFTVLVLTQLFNCFNARSATASAFRAAFSNRWLWAAVALSARCRWPSCTCPSSTWPSAPCRSRPASGACVWRWPAACSGSAKGASCCAGAARRAPAAARGR